MAFDATEKIKIEFKCRGENACTNFSSCSHASEGSTAFCTLSQEFSNLKNKIASPRLGKNDALLLLLNDSVQKECKAMEVSSYILETKELMLAIKSPNTELHIITNELVNYDSTVLASMAIAANILGKPLTTVPLIFAPEKHGVKYFYYCPSSLKPDFEKFKERIKKFIRRDDESRSEVDKWVRRNFSRRNKLSKKLGFLSGKSPAEFCENLFRVNKAEKAEIIKKCESNSKIFPEGRGFTLLPKVDAWLRGEQSVLENVKRLDEFFQSICRDLDEHDFKEFKGFTLQKIYQYIHHLLLLSEWQLENKTLKDEEREEIFKAIFSNDYDDDEHNWDVIREQFENWLSPSDDDLCGVIRIDDAVFSAALDNLIFFPIDESKITLCYSFCLFLSAQSKEDGVAWYATAKANTGGEFALDNPVFIHTSYETPEVRKFASAYSVVINNSPEIKMRLNELKSIILLYATA